MRKEVCGETGRVTSLKVSPPPGKVLSDYNGTGCPYFVSHLQATHTTSTTSRAAHAIAATPSHVIGMSKVAPTNEPRRPGLPYHILYDTSQAVQAQEVVSLTQQSWPCPPLVRYGQQCLGTASRHLGQYLPHPSTGEGIELLGLLLHKPIDLRREAQIDPFSWG